MNSIGQNQGLQPIGPVVQVPEPSSKLSPAMEQTSRPNENPAAQNSEKNLQVKAPVQQPEVGLRYQDPEKMREFVAKVSEALRKAAGEPYLVGFRHDPDSEGYLIEIRKADGTLVTSFQPEKVLNLHGKLDDLSGMVIDRKT